MRARSYKPRKVNVVTLGCAKNIFDSEVMMAQLRANDFEVEHEAKQDDSGIVIVNTCGFIEAANVFHRMLHGALMSPPLP